MVKLNVENLLREKGKTRYWLVKEMQTTYAMVNSYCDNTCVYLHLETIYKLCTALECEPNDLFVIEQNDRG